jgi:hypothetical protein
VAGVTGLEPATSGVTGRRSNQLSYTPGNALLRAAVVPRAPWGVKHMPSFSALFQRFGLNASHGPSETNMLR